MILALPSFIMGVNHTLDFEDNDSVSIHHKGNPYSSRGLIKAFCSEVMHFCKEKYTFLQLYEL